MESEDGRRSWVPDWCIQKIREEKKAESFVTAQDRTQALGLHLNSKFTPEQMERLEQAKGFVRGSIKQYGPYAELAVILLLPEFLEGLQSAGDQK